MQLVYESESISEEKTIHFHASAQAITLHNNEEEKLLKKIKINLNIRHCTLSVLNIPIQSLVNERQDFCQDCRGNTLSVNHNLPLRKRDLRHYKKEHRELGFWKVLPRGLLYLLFLFSTRHIYTTHKCVNKTSVFISLHVTSSCSHSISNYFLSNTLKSQFPWRMALLQCLKKNQLSETW